MLAYLALAALGMALGGLGLQQVIQRGSSGLGLTIARGIWMVMSALIALFAGGYVAGRASGVIPTRIGGVEGLVVASMVFLLLFTATGTGFSAAGGSSSALLGAPVSSAADLAGEVKVQNLMGQAYSGLLLRSIPARSPGRWSAVWLAATPGSAAGYLASEAGISRAEASQRLDRIRLQVVGAIREAGRVTARATQATGWFFFVTIVLGSLAALFAGALGARRNIQHPLSERNRRLAMQARPEWHGYGYVGRIMRARAPLDLIFTRGRRRLVGVT